jgi:hypothetical protein
MQVVMTKFKNWCGMPSVVGAIDDIHMAITKPSSAFAEDYYYHKIKGYNIVAQVVVGRKKKFTNVYVGLFASVNDSQVLKKSWLYRPALQGNFFNMVVGSQGGLPPYLLIDKGYPLFPWLMTLHKENGEHHLVLEILYNCKHKCERSINAFDILKQTCRKFMKKRKVAYNYFT